ncbi:MAG: hypothetical protein ACKVQT_28940 [Burkholderiales bacterium]
MIRPEPARWFYLLVARDDAFLALEALATTGAVEIEWHRGEHADPAAERIRELLRDYATLSRRYQAYWPPARKPALSRMGPSATIAHAVARIDAWSVEAQPIIARLQHAETAISSQDTMARLIGQLSDTSIDFSAIGMDGAAVVANVFVYPAGTGVSLPSAVLLRAVQIGEEMHLLAVGPPAGLEPLAQQITAAGGRRVQLPGWLRPSAAENLALIAEQRASHAAAAAAARAELSAVHAHHELALALGDLARASWCFENAGAIESGEVFSRITGWTSAPDRASAAIDKSGARALMSFPNPPRGVRPPLLLRNPWWARPFEVFSRLFGLPGEQGADPSMLLAFAVPLLFGYMFGDLGQGLVLAAIGFALKDRLPVFRLLIPAGLSAAVFGLLFGAVFSLEHVVEPLWMAPLERPLAVLTMPLAGGVVLLLIGVALDGLAAFWRRELPAWLIADGAFVFVYVGILGAFLHQGGIVIATAGTIAFALARVCRERRAVAALQAFGELLERTFQILINTLSFARVGAFALAHAGLSSAVVALADATGGGFLWLLVLVIGNIVIILLEGLVVSIQTTRLILFEFFTRFFHAEGRELRPLSPPPFSAEEN